MHDIGDGHSHEHEQEHEPEHEPRTTITMKAPPRAEARRRAVIPGDRLDPNTAQTPGMFRQAAVNAARVGAQKIWAGTVAIEPDAKTGFTITAPLRA